MIAYLAFFITFLYALRFEYYEGANSFKQTEPQPSDTLRQSYRKLDKCLGYETRAVVWRRVYIASCLAALILYYILNGTFFIPEHTLMLTVITIYAIFYANWKLYNAHITTKAVSWCRDNLKNIRNKHNENNKNN